MAPRRLKLVFDEMFSRHHVGFLAKEAQLAEAKHIIELGWGGTPDAEWIPKSVELDFVVITGDRNERTRGYTTRDLEDLGARVVLFASFWDHLNRWDRAKWLVRHFEQLCRHISTMKTGQVLLLDRLARATPVMAEREIGGERSAAG